MAITRTLDVVEAVNANIKRIKVVSTDDASAVASDISTLQVDDTNTVHVNDTDVSGASWVIDEDTMTSDSATKVPTQQSVKAYVDANAGGGGGGGAPIDSPAFTTKATIAFTGTPTAPQFAVADYAGDIANTGFTIDTYNGTCWLNNGTNISISSLTSDTNVYPNSTFAEVQLSYGGILLTRNATLIQYAYDNSGESPTQTPVCTIDGSGITMTAGGNILLDKSTGAETSHAVTIDAQAGVITTSALTTAGGSSYLVTLTNSKIVGTGSIVVASIVGGTNTTKNITVESKCTASHTATFTIYNNTASTALNGTVIINFIVV
jgi:hypothetical protein